MLIKGKKAINFDETWVELFFIILLIIGFLISVSLGSAFFSYIVIFLCSFMAGRFLNLRKVSFPYYLIVLGFLIGYLLGTRYGNWKITLFVFALGFGISWYVHEKKLMR